MKLSTSNLYFINYKNSVRGTGGVGTVSRDMIRYYPDMHFIFWDGSSASRPEDLGIHIPDRLDKFVHNKFAKAYLWPVLHGLPIKVSPDDLVSTQLQIQNQAKLIADKIIGFAKAQSQQDDQNIYWLNDYTAIFLIAELRKLDKAATIILSFRTPFGINGNYPAFLDASIIFLEVFLQLDYITFHRQADLNHFVWFIRDKYKHKLQGITHDTSKQTAEILLKDGHPIKLEVIPMGNNRGYRKSLSRGKVAKNFCAQLKAAHPRTTIIAGISRFEESKGIEYEVDCIGALLNDHPELVGKFVLLRYSYISDNKKHSKEYDSFRKRVEAKIKRINARFSNDSWTPIIYDFNRKLDDAEVTGLLMASDILMIASLADGFNHLALEAVHSQRGASSIQLLLSDIGAADYIRGHKRLSHNIENDASVLYDSIRSTGFKSWLNQRRLGLSATKLSSKKWASTIVGHAYRIRRTKI